MSAVSFHSILQSNKKFERNLTLSHVQSQNEETTKTSRSACQKNAQPLRSAHKQTKNDGFRPEDEKRPRSARSVSSQSSEKTQRHPSTRVQTAAQVQQIHG